MPSDSTRSVPPADSGSGERATESPIAPPRTIPSRPGERTVISREQQIWGPLQVSSPRGELEHRLVGERLEYFELQEYVGGGGMGTVFRALDTRLNRSVALKVLAREQALDEETARRFQNEAQAAARLDHDGIARVHYVGEDRGLQFIVFEFIEGTNVRDVVYQRGLLSPAEAVRITLQVADALSHAAAREVVHRDIKPSNILITPEGRAKLVDMGLARQHHLKENAEDLTASGVTLGTFDYISPEQARDPRVADVRSDIYSLGCTLYFMLTGQPPFPEGTVLQKLLRHQNDTPTDPRQFAADLPPELVQVLFRMLAKEPVHRYQHPSDLMRDLLVLARQWGWEEAVPPPAIETYPLAARPSDSFFQRTAPIWLPLAGLALVVLGMQISSQMSEPLSANVGHATLAKTVDPQQPTPTATGRRHTAEGAVRPAQPAAGKRSPAQAAAAASTAEHAIPARKGASEPPAGIDTGTPIDTRPLAPQDQVPPEDATDASAVDSAEEGEATEVTENDPAANSLTLPAAASADSPATLPPEEFRSRSGETSLPPVHMHIIRGPDRPGTELQLQAVCDQAADGDVVELQFDGPVAILPLELTNRDLTLRAAKGFQPALVLRPPASRAQQPPGMIRVAGGHLVCIGLDLRLELPITGEPTVGWTVFALDHAEFVQLDRCFITIRNAAPDEQRAYHPETAFFSLQEGHADHLAGARDDSHRGPGLDSESVVRLSDCVLRGEASVLSASPWPSVSFQWHNGLAALSEPLLRVRAGQDRGETSALLRVEMEHLSLDIPQGLVALEAAAIAPRERQVSLTCTNSILRGQPGAALIVEPREQLADGASRRLHWKSDRNVYEGFAVFWRRLDPSSSDVLEETAWSDWNSFWSGSREVRGSAGWSAATQQRPPHERLPNDYRLDARSPARQGAVDLTDCGGALDRLPGGAAEIHPATPLSENALRANQFAPGYEVPNSGPRTELQSTPPPAEAGDVNPR